MFEQGVCHNVLEDSVGKTHGALDSRSGEAVGVHCRCCTGEPRAGLAPQERACRVRRGPRAALGPACGTRAETVVM